MMANKGANLFVQDLVIIIAKDFVTFRSSKISFSDIFRLRNCILEKLLYNGTTKNQNQNHKSRFYANEGDYGL